MKEPRDTKARKESEAKMKAHFEAGGTVEEWNKMYDITPDYVRSFPKPLIVQNRLINMVKP